ncbi:reverse transcriptase domain-containing protein, partial [Tanacetum coccineum]
MINGSLSEKGRMELYNMLKYNLDIFSWKPADMTGVLRSIAEHRLNIREGCQPIRQKRRGQAPDRNKAIQEEVAKLVEAEIMREVHYHDLLSNPVMKSTRKSNLSADIPSSIFLDVYKGYHQIQMVEEDEEKTAFHTNQGVFCYTKMSFGLKNAGATYQRLVDKAFEKQIGRNLEVYVDDLHARNQSLPRKSGSDDEATVTLNIKRSSKPKRKAGELKQNLIQIREKVTSFLQNPQKGSGKRGPFDGKGLTASTSLFCQSCLANPINQLQFNGKTGFSISARHEEAEEILPSTPGGADFIAKTPDEEGPSMEVQAEEAIPEPCTLFTNGSSCLEGSGAGLILKSPEGEEFTYALRFKFDASNNKAEYEAFVAGLRIAEQIGVKNLIAKVDSHLVPNQINGLYETKEQSMTQYLEKAKTLIDSFKIFSIEQAPRSENKKADALSKILVHKLRPPH